MVEPIFGVGRLTNVQMNCFKTIRAVAQKPRRKEADPRLRSEQVNPILAAIGWDNCRPTYFEQKALAAFSLKQRHAEVFHVERLFGINFTPAPIHFTQAARTEFGMNLRRD